MIDAPHKRSDLYDPRRQAAAGGHGYSVFVRVAKITLPIIALIIMGVLVARLSKDPQQQLSQMKPDEKTTPGQIEIVAPKYEGRDAQGRAYTVTAERAERAMDAPDTVIFQKPVADITLQDKSWVAVRAAEGQFDRATEQLKLSGGISIFHDSGHELQLDDIIINLKDSSASSAHPVSAQGPMGRIRARNLSVTDAGNIIIFGGPATLTLSKLSGKAKKS